jgi:hypothetical protein
MKKILIVLFGVLALGSCKKENPNNSITISKDEYEGLKSQERDYPKPFSKTDLPNGTNGHDMIVLGSDGHEYILVSSNTTGFTHSGECLKCKAKEYELKSLLYQILNKKNKDTIK